MKVVVTGGAGFIGSNFVRAMAEGRYNLKPSRLEVIDKLTYAGNVDNIEDLIEDGKVHFHKIDICDYDSVYEIANDADYIFNFAAESHVDRSIANAHEFIQTNVLGTQVLLDVTLNATTKPRFIQISTDEVYGSIASGSWDESYPLKPNSPYAASKAAAELLVRAYVKTHGLDAVITRCSNNYGKYQFPEKVIPFFIQQIIQGKKIPIYGDGLNTREWIHVLDHCRGIALVAELSQKGAIYNIGSGYELTNLELAEKILSIMGADSSSKEFVQDRKGHDLRYSVNWEKIKNDMGFVPEIDFDQGLVETISWYRANNLS
jgi:dTDP-glucose 4,6-dehydratase